MEQNHGAPGGFNGGQLRDVRSWRRSRSDRMVAGVCGGVGRALNIDPVLIRVVVGVLIFAGGAGLPLYVAAWLLMPDEGADTSPAQDLLGDRARTNHPWLWPVVIGAGVFVAIGISSSMKVWPFSFPGPLIIIFLLWFFVFRKKGRGSCGPNHGSPQSPPHGQQHPPFRPGDHLGARPTDTPAGQRPVDTPLGGTPGAGSSYPTSPASSATQRPRLQDTVASGQQPVWTEDDPLGLYVDEPAAPAPRPAAEPPSRPGRRGVKPAVVALTALAMLITWGATASLPVMFAIGTGVLGVGMILGAFLGRTRGLLPVGLLLAIGVAATSVFSAVPEVGDRTFAPTGTVTADNATYRTGIGSTVVDLSKVTTFGPGAKVTVSGEVGELVVKVPADVDITGEATIEFGEIRNDGQTVDGAGLTRPLDSLGPDGKAGPKTVELDLDLRAGSITVEHP